MAKDKLNGYELSRNWFDFAFENPEKISPNHAAIYFFAIEHCNRLGWKRKFGFPTQMAMDALGIKKHQTYIRYFNDLCEWGFFDLIQKSQNQYSANIISLISANPKNGKALDKAIITHRAKQTETNGQSNGQSNSSIDKPLTNKPINSIVSPPDGVDVLHFYIAKSFHKMFYDSKQNKSLKEAKLNTWVNTVRLILEVDEIPTIQLVGIKHFLQAGINKDKGVKSFWSDTIFSINALRKKSDDGTYYIDRIKQDAKRWIERNPEKEEEIYKAHQRLIEAANG